jgi:hypothetical protein
MAAGPAQSASRSALRNCCTRSCLGAQKNSCGAACSASFPCEKQHTRLAKSDRGAEVDEIMGIVREAEDEIATQVL